jgi:hypothetical protein
MDFANNVADLLSFIALISALVISMKFSKRKDLFQIKLFIVLSIVTNVIDII